MATCAVGPMLWSFPCPRYYVRLRLLEERVLEPSNSSASGCQALSDSSVNELIAEGAEGAEEVPTIQAVTKWAHDACTGNH